MTNIAIFVSGQGSNCENIIKHFSISKDIKISLVLSNRADAYALVRAKKYNVPTEVVSKDEFKNENTLMAIMKKYEIDFIVLAGFLLMVSDFLINRYQHKIINIHPALLPSFPGLDAQGQALEYGVKIAGCTVHFVDEGTDSGPFILQKPVPVLNDDTEESLAARILVEEHKAMPEALRLWALGKLEIQGRRVIVHP